MSDLNLHEIKNEPLSADKGDFDLNGSMIIGPVEHKTNIRFRNMDDFESCSNAIDIDFDSEDVTFTGYNLILNAHQFKVVERSAYAKGTKYMQEIDENHGHNCYIPTSGVCFINCINCFTDRDYTKYLEDFI